MTSTDLRRVSMSAEQAAEIERLIPMLMRANQNERAQRLMSLSLAYKFAKQCEEVPQALPPNVIRFPGHSVRA